MKLLRFLLFPVVPVYFLITWLRNKAYDVGVFSFKTYNFPIICVGNLSAGGTGKSPMVGFLISSLKADYKLATLSRGYGRLTKGFLQAKEGMSFKDLGDESFQYFENFGDDITVAVCENRQNGINKLLENSSKPDLIILDDAYQHRKVKAGLSILLTTYDNLFTNDFVLPTGNLREPKSGYKRAEIIVVTKCPENILDTEKNRITKDIRLLPHQNIYFSRIGYSKWVFSYNKKIELKQLPKFTLVTGIANALPLVNYLKQNDLTFNHLEFADHYNFKPLDIERLSALDFILTTEKDYMRLKDYKVLKEKLFYVPIKVLLDFETKFLKEITGFVTSMK